MLLLLAACASGPSDLPTPHPAAPARRRARGATLTVDAAGAGDWRSITDAIAAAAPGDTIEVAPGTYYGSIDFLGKSLVIRSTAGAESTLVRGAPGQPVVVVEGGEGASTTLSGFTLSGGGGPDKPAIEANFSAIQLTDCIVTGNTGTMPLYVRSGHVVVERTTFIDNTGSAGMVMQTRRGSTILKDSRVVCGGIPVGYESEHGASLVHGTRFECEGGIALRLYHGDARVDRSVVHGLLKVENDSSGEEPVVVEGSVLLGGADVYYAPLQIRNSVSTGPIVASFAALSIEGSVLTGVDGCAVQVSRSSYTQRYNDWWDNTTNACSGADPVGQGGSFSADPGFLDPAAEDYRLGVGSACLDAGPTEAGWEDLDGSRNDVGAHGGPLPLGGG